MMSTKFFVGILLIAKISYAWTFAVQETPNARVYSTGVEWVCSQDADCTTLGSSCVNNACQCPSGYVFNAAMTSCLAAATNYGDRCKETAQCTVFLGAGGLCNENQCTCSVGYHYVHGRCYKSAGLNQACRADDDCYVNSDFGAFSCQNGTCVCRDGYYQREYRTCRLKATEPGDECTIDMDCTYDENAKCDKKWGKCLAESGNNIVNAALEGSESQVSQTFPIGVVDLGMNDGCTSNEQCSIVLGEAICDSKTKLCTCKPGYFFDSKKVRCNADIGEKCKKGDTNIIENSKCRFGQWSCRGATVPSKNNRVCLSATTDFDKFCYYDEECYVFGPDASCINNRCTCSYGSHYSAENMFCWVNKLIGEKCVVDEDCFVPGFGSKLSCNSESVCACPNGTHVNAAGSACAKDVPVLGDACSGNADCTGLKNTVCYEGHCTCLMYYFELAGQCVKGNFASCKRDSDCKTENSKCLGERCSCANPYVSAGTDLCVKPASFGGFCQHDAQCKANTPKSYCDSTSTCACPENYLHFHDRCYQIRGFGDLCTWSTDLCWDEDHPDSMLCDNSICRCKAGYRPQYSTVVYCEDISKLPNAASKNTFLSLFGLILFSTRIMGLF